MAKIELFPGEFVDITPNIGDSYNGSTGASNTSNVGSIPTSPAKYPMKYTILKYEHIFDVDLLPCPFCGCSGNSYDGDDTLDLVVEHQIIDGEMTYSTSIGCDGCGITVGVVGYTGKCDEMAKRNAIISTVNAWNRRAFYENKKITP